MLATCYFSNTINHEGHVLKHVTLCYSYFKNARSMLIYGSNVLMCLCAYKHAYNVLKCNFFSFFLHTNFKIVGYKAVSNIYARTFQANISSRWTLLCSFIITVWLEMVKKKRLMFTTNFLCSCTISCLKTTVANLWLLYKLETV